MRQTTRTLVAAAALLFAAGSVLALEGSSGYTATLLFGQSDVAAGTQYPPGFAGVRWADVDTNTFGPGGNTSQGDPVIASNAHGDAFLLVNGSRNQRDDTYTGVIRWDGASFVHLSQDLLQNGAGGLVGMRTEGVAVSPVTAGLLTTGHPVVLRTRRTAGSLALEVWSIDPSQSPAVLSLVHDLGTGAPGSTIGIDTAGNLFVHRQDGKVYKLAFEGTGYVQTVLATGISQEGIVLGDDDAPYGFPAGTTSLWGQGSTIDILRIDPASGATTVHARVRSGQWFRGWAWDSTGRFWIGLKNGYRDDYVTEVRAGRTTGTKGIGKSIPDGIWSLGAGPAGEVHVVEIDWPRADYFALEPDAGGGGGGGGGGGNGKGKPK